MQITVRSTSLLRVTDSLHREERQGHTLFVSPRTGGYMVLHSDEKIKFNILEKLMKSHEPTSLAQLGSLPGWPDPTVSGERAVLELFRARLISIDGIALGVSSTRKLEQETLLTPQPRTTGAPALCIFHLHNYCNLACKYCYTIEKDPKNPQTKRNRLSLATMLDMVNQLSSMPSPSTCFEFHGGEPTMAFSDIMEVVEHVEKIYGAVAKNRSYSIQTNAFSLTQKMVDFFKKYNFKVRVSLDGTPDTHNEFRVSHGGRGSYAEVVRGIALLQKSGIAAHAVCVVHRHNVGLMKEMYDSMNSLGVAGIRFLPVFQSGNATDQDWVDGQTFFDAYFELIEHLLKRKKQGDTLCPLPNLVAGEINAITAQSRTYMCMRTPCGAADSMIAIDVNGDIYPCEEMIGKLEFKIGTGNIREALNNNPLVATLRSRHVDDIDDCRTCEWKQMCHGGCVHKSYTHFKRLDAKSEFCSYFKRIYRELIWLEFFSPGSLKSLGAIS